MKKKKNDGGEPLSSSIVIDEFHFLCRLIDTVEMAETGQETGYGPGDICRRLITPSARVRLHGLHGLLGDTPRAFGRTSCSAVRPLGQV